MLWWGQLLYKETAAISNRNKPHKNVPQHHRFAVSPEIVPVPGSHRNVASLISSQSYITFGRSFSCQRLMKKQITAVNENMFIWTNDLYGIIFLQV